MQVRRDGEWQMQPCEQLVPGDLIRLEAGDRVSADCRLLEVADLGLREAALTGEAEAVFKQAQLVLEASTPVLERQNCLFQGTEVVRGRGLAVVTATGMATELGQIAELINTAGGETTPLQQRLDGLANVLVGSALALVAALVTLGLLLGQNALDLLEVGLSMAVAIVPEGLPAVITVTLAIGTQWMVKRAALIRRLPAVEGLGSVTVICSDKTGTLTLNRQVVQELRCGTQSIAVSGQGYEPHGGFSAQELTGPPSAAAGCAAGAQRLLLEAGVLTGVQGAMVAEMAPADCRCVVYGLSYSVGIAAFAGTTPMLCEWMVGRMGWVHGPALYTLAAALVSLVVLVRLKPAQLASLD